MTIAGVVALAASGLAFFQAASAVQMPQPETQEQHSPGKLVRHHFNGAQQLLSDILIQEQLLLMDTAKSEAHTKAIILEHCTARMWYMSVGQQNYEKFEVYDMDRNMPSPSRWDQVRTAPSMVKDMLQLTDAQEKAIEKVHNTKHPNDPKVGYVTGIEFVKFRWTILTNRVPAIMDILTPSQRKEWQTIYTKASAAMKKAAETGKP